jgi:succinate dehydrogenase / fumarate reductase cytochrome b subunit
MDRTAFSHDSLQIWKCSIFSPRPALPPSPASWKILQSVRNFRALNIFICRWSYKTEMAENASLFGRYEFVIRRLHSLTGLLPVGGFLIVHLLTNAAVLDNSYQQRVDLIHGLGTYTLEIVEWVFIFLPLLFHGIVGFFIIAQGKGNVSTYPYRENFRYTLQRWTGIIAFAFIAWHVFHTRGWINSEWWLDQVTRRVGGGTFDPKDATRSMAKAVQFAPWIVPVYTVGILSAVYHLANGLWTMGITWGVWTGRNAQWWASLACGAFGLALAAAGLAALYGFWTFPVTG